MKFPIKFCKNPKYDENYFTLIIKTLDYCNYDCEYCCENCNIKKLNKNKINLNILYKYIIQILPYIYSMNKKLKVSLYGGEPTLHPDLVEFCEKIFNLDKNIYLEMYTNFSKSIAYYNKLLNFNIKLIITYHYTKYMTYEQFFNKIKMFNIDYLSNNFIINIMYEQQTSEQCILTLNDINNYFNANNIKPILPVLLKNVRTTDNFESAYSTKLLKVFYETSKEINDEFYKLYMIEFSDKTKRYLTDEDLELIDLCFNKWLCSTGQTSLYVEPNGNIYRCVSYKQMEDKIKQDKSIGNIATMKSINFNPTVCNNFSFCTDYDSNKVNIFNLKNTDVIQEKLKQQIKK